MKELTLNKHKLICFIAEYSYCKANGFPLNEGHTPPSMVYEAVERDLDKWLEAKENKE